jgi:ABC-type Fe3+/spermidine/putrescine transport system ATPase subunit
MTAPVQPVASGHSVEVRGALKRYNKHAVLAGFNLDIRAGRFLVLLGPSGSGKTTLARCLAGVERLDAGTISFSGREVANGKRQLPPERRNLAMVFQDYALWPHLSALGNVSYALRRLHLSGASARQRALDALDQVGLAGLADRYPHELSGGEQQRVALARAVVARPGLLLFDEPLSNLDADLRDRLRVQIATLARDSGATVVYITHDQSEAFALADEIAVLDKGNLLQMGSPEEVYLRPATLFVARFTGSAGDFPGTVAHIDSASVRVQVTDGQQLTARHTSALRIGSAVRVLVRPAGTRISRDLAAAGSSLRGTVIDVAYRGRGYDHVLELPGGTLSAVFDPERFERGAEVTVTIDPNACVAYPAERNVNGENIGASDKMALVGGAAFAALEPAK